VKDGYGQAPPEVSRGSTPRETSDADTTPLTGVLFLSSRNSFVFDQGIRRLSRLRMSRRASPGPFLFLLGKEASALHRFIIAQALVLLL